MQISLDGLTESGDLQVSVPTFEEFVAAKIAQTFSNEDLVYLTQLGDVNADFPGIENLLLLQCRDAMLVTSESWTHWIIEFFSGWIVHKAELEKYMTRSVVNVFPWYRYEGHILLNNFQHKRDHILIVRVPYRAEDREHTMMGCDIYCYDRRNRWGIIRPRELYDYFTTILCHMIEYSHAKSKVWRIARHALGVQLVFALQAIQRESEIEYPLLPTKYAEYFAKIGGESVH